MGTITKSQNFLFNVGDLPYYFYRVEGECANLDCVLGNVDAVENCEQGVRFVKNVLARSVEEVCVKLQEKGFTHPVTSIQKFSRPAERSERLSQEADGIDHSCNTLEEVPFDEIQSCINYLSTSYVIEMAMAVTGGFVTQIGTSGGMTFGSQTVMSASSYSYTGGGLLTFGSETVVTSNDLGILSDTWGVDIDVSEIEADLEAIDASALTPLTRTITPLCGCTSLPQIIELSHNLNKSKVFSQYLQRNNFQFSDIIDLTYSINTGKWQANSTFSGTGDDGSSIEQWDILFSWGCDTTLGASTIEPFWNLSFFVSRKNKTTGLDFETRILLGIPTTAVCIEDDVLNFSLALDVPNCIVSLNTSENIDIRVCRDQAKIFKDLFWVNNPFRIRIAAFDLESATVPLFDLTPAYPDATPEVLVGQSTTTNGISSLGPNSNIVYQTQEDVQINGEEPVVNPIPTSVAGTPNSDLIEPVVIDTTNTVASNPLFVPPTPPEPVFNQSTIPVASTSGPVPIIISQPHKEEVVIQQDPSLYPPPNNLVVGNPPEVYKRNS